MVRSPSLYISAQVPKLLMCDVERKPVWSSCLFVKCKQLLCLILWLIQSSLNVFALGIFTCVLFKMCCWIQACVFGILSWNDFSFNLFFFPLGILIYITVGKHQCYDKLSYLIGIVWILLKSCKWVLVVVFERLHVPISNRQLCTLQKWFPGSLDILVTAIGS